jgi:hypothetical protein
MSKDQARLGELAIRFRGTRDPVERQEIATEYERTVQRLIQSGWSEAPPPEDQLPDEWMPRDFHQCLSRNTAFPQVGTSGRP